MVHVDVRAAGEGKKSRASPRRTTCVRVDGMVAHVLGCPRRRHPHPTSIIGSELKLRRLDEPTGGRSDGHTVQLVEGVIHEVIDTSSWGSALINRGELIDVIFAVGATVDAAVKGLELKLKLEGVVVVAIRHASAPRTAGWEFVCCEYFRLDTAGSIDVPTVHGMASVAGDCRLAAMERGPAVTHDFESMSLSMALASAGAGLPPSADSSSS